MTRHDVHKLFDLLEHLYQGKKQSRDDVTVAIWAKVFEPWSYAQVRQAVIERARVNRYFPDPSEIAEFLSPAPLVTEMRFAQPSLDELSREAYRKARTSVHLFGNDLKSAYDWMPSDAQKVIGEMGGVEKFAPPDKPFFEMELFMSVYRRLAEAGALSR